VTTRARSGVLERRADAADEYAPPFGGRGGVHAEQGLLEQVARGALAGAMATGPMTAAMAAMHRQLPTAQRFPLPPRMITTRVTRNAGAEALVETRSRRDVMTYASHFGYGAAMGAAYGTVAERLPGAPVTRGVLWGLAVWAGSYLGWLPLSGLRASPTRLPAGREALLFTAHVVYGAALGWLHERLRRPPAAEPSAL
jgi:hypothetical protein